MNRLTRVLAAIARAFRETYADPIEHPIVVTALPEPRAIDVVVPPPDPYADLEPEERDYLVKQDQRLTPSELAYFGINMPPSLPTPSIPDNHIGCTGQEELFTIYVPRSPRRTLSELLAQQCELSVHNITKESIAASGAYWEFWALWDWANTTESQHFLEEENVVYNLYKISNAYVLETYSFGEKLQQYYCTLLDLPEFKFKPIGTAWRDPEEDQAAARQRRQYALDHSRAQKGGK